MKIFFFFVCVVTVEMNRKYAVKDDSEAGPIDSCSRILGTVKG